MAEFLEPHTGAQPRVARPVAGAGNSDALTQSLRQRLSAGLLLAYRRQLGCPAARLTCAHLCKVKPYLHVPTLFFGEAIWAVLIRNVVVGLNDTSGAQTELQDRVPIFLMAQLCLDCYWIVTSLQAELKCGRSEFRKNSMSCASGDREYGRKLPVIPLWSYVTPCRYPR